MVSYISNLRDSKEVLTLDYKIFPFPLTEGGMIEVEATPI